MNRLAFLILLISTITAVAQARKIDFTQPLVDQDNEVITECDDQSKPQPVCKTHVPLTLGVVVMRSLLAPEQNVAAEDSWKRGALALKLHKATGEELTAEEIALIKKQIAKVYAPLIVYRSFSILDPAVK